MELIGKLYGGPAEESGIISVLVYIAFYREGIIATKVKMKKETEYFRLKYNDVRSVEYRAPGFMKRGGMTILLRSLPKYENYFMFDVTKDNAEMCERIRDHINSIISF